MQEIRIGDIVIVEQGIGIIRYVGDIYYGVEVKGPPVSGGNNGSFNNKQYFKCRSENGIFIKQSDIKRIIAPEEILNKLGEIYEILKSSKKLENKLSYNLLNDKYTKLSTEYHIVCRQCKELELDVSICREKLSLIKEEYKEKLLETGKLHSKINKAEEQIGSRLSQFNMKDIVNKMKSNENADNAYYEIPDYSKSMVNDKHQSIQGQMENAEENKHRKQKSSISLALLEETTDFSKIAQDVRFLGQARGSIDFDAPINPTHYKKYSNTTLEVLNVYRNQKPDKNEMGDEVQTDDNIIYHSRRARDSLTIDNLQPKTARDSIVINEDINDNKNRRRRKARDSRIANDVDIEDNDDAIQMDNNVSKSGFGLGNAASHMIKDDPFGTNFAHNMTQRNPAKLKEMKARNSVSNGATFMSKAILESHDENMADSQNMHKKSDTMTSDSSAYKFFNSVD